ncbi:MFS transporter [Nocardia sp. NBC_01327]|uniref:MFS transporter n=1 Tax=Nocardia sp. NBC_01327 TaxID=2903593 RepID=UPI002E0E2411|nr:MFS transporter [Nocardia sp. NBC_01327]
MPNTAASSENQVVQNPLSVRPGLVLTALLICQLMIVLDVTVMNVALPRIKSDLHFSATGLAWVIDAYTLVFGGLLLLGGRAGDMLGRRRIFIAGIALFTLASLLGGLAPAAGWLVVARVAQGAGAAMAGPNALALLTTIFTEPKARLRALALYSGMAGAGFAIGLIVGGFLTEWFTWRSVLFINVPLGVLVLFVALRYMPVVARQPGRLDLPGAVTSTAGVAALVYGFVSAGSHGWNDAVTDVSLIIGSVMIVAFVVIELRSEAPLLQLRLFADRNRGVAYFNLFVGYMGSMSMFFFLTLYMQDVRGMGPLTTGLAFLPTAVLMFALIRLIPWLLPKFGPKPMTMIGSLFLIAGLVLPTQLSTDTAYFPLVFIVAVLMGCGTALALMPLGVIIMTSVPSSSAGVAGGALQTIQQTGAALGLAILVTVFGASEQGAVGPPDQVLVSGITAAFAAAAVMGVLNFLGTFAFRRV